MEFLYSILDSRFLQLPIVYSCIPVFLFGAGYYIKQWMETFSKRKHIFYSLLHIDISIHTSKRLYILSELINDMPKYFNIGNRQLYNEIEYFLQSFKLNYDSTELLTLEREKRFINFLLILSNKSWFWSRPYKSIADIKRIGYIPKGIIERELGEDFLYTNQLEHNREIFEFLDEPEIKILFEKYKEKNTK